MPLPVHLSPSPFGELFSDLFEEGTSVAYRQGRRPAEVEDRDGATSASSFPSRARKSAVFCLRDRLEDDNGDAAEWWPCLRTAHEHVIGWTLSRHDEAREYVELLLRRVAGKALALLLKDWESGDNSSNNRRNQSRSSTSILSISSLLDGSSAVLSAEQARQWVLEANSCDNGEEDDPTRYLTVVLHYAVTQLCEIVQALEENAAMSSDEKRRSRRDWSQRGADGSARRSGSSDAIRGSSGAAPATMATTFFPNGILIGGWTTLQLLLSDSRVDPFVQRGAACVLARVLLEGRQLEQRGQLLSPVDPILESFIAWITTRLQSSANDCLAAATPSLTAVMTDSRCREIFVGLGGIGCVTRHLRYRQPLSGSSTSTASASAQQLYDLAFCLWVLSYDCQANETIRRHFHRDGAVASLVEMVSSAPREKVVRLALSTLRNLATCQDSSRAALDPSLPQSAVSGSVFLTDMIGCGFLKAVDGMKGRQWTDPEFAEDLELIHQLLHETCKQMTRWDVYVSEVKSGHLKWGVLHTEKFFLENAKRMEGKEGNFEIVKDLLRLTTAYDDDVAAIACFDIGEFVRHYPNGRAIAKSLGARDVVMKLIEHDNPELQRQALLCVSKMLIQNRQYVDSR